MSNQPRGIYTLLTAGEISAIETIVIHQSNSVSDRYEIRECIHALLNGWFLRAPQDYRLILGTKVSGDIVHARVTGDREVGAYLPDVFFDWFPVHDGVKFIDISEKQ